MFKQGNLDLVEGPKDPQTPGKENADAGAGDTTKHGSMDTHNDPGLPRIDSKLSNSSIQSHNNERDSNKATTMDSCKANLSKSPSAKLR